MKYLIGCMIATFILAGCSVAELKAMSAGISDNVTEEAIEEAIRECPEPVECPHITHVICPENIDDETTAKLNRITFGETTDTAPIRWFTIALKKDMKYSVSVSGRDASSTTENPSQLDTVLEIRDTNNRRKYDDTGRIMNRNDDTFGYGSRVIFTPIEDGIHYIHVSTVSNARGSFKLEAITLSDLLKTSNKKVYGVK